MRKERFSSKPRVEPLTIAYTVNGETKVFKHCRFQSVKAKCTCGFLRYTRKGYFKRQQIEGMKDHLAIATLYPEQHTLNVSMDMQGYSNG